MKELQEIDVEILRTLLKDGRKSFTDIAKEYQTSKDVIWKHYKNMEDAGFIVGATVQLNFPKLGYSGIAVIMLSVEPRRLNEVFERLKKIPDVSCYRYYNSPNNVAVISRLVNLRDLEAFKELICKETSINEITARLWTNMRNVPENVLVNPSENLLSDDEEKPETQAVAEEESVVVDDLDRQIIEILERDGRLAFTKISDELDVSVDTIDRRYEKLVRGNIIKVSIQINPLKLGYQAILHVDVAFKIKVKLQE